MFHLFHYKHRLSSNNVGYCLKLFHVRTIYHVIKFVKKVHGSKEKYYVCKSFFVNFVYIAVIRFKFEVNPITNVKNTQSQRIVPLQYGNT